MELFYIKVLLNTAKIIYLLNLYVDIVNDIQVIEHSLVENSSYETSN